MASATDTPIFVLLSIILLLMGFLLPLVDIAVNGSGTSNNIQEGNNDTGFLTGVISFIGFMAQALFWYYPALPFYIGIIKLVITYTWWYLLIRLIRGI